MITKQRAVKQNVTIKQNVFDYVESKINMNRITQADMERLALEAPPARVESFAPDQGLMVIYGKEKSNKSGFTINLATDISNGDDNLGVWATNKCKVWYLDLEQAAHILARRHKKLLAGKKCKGDNILFYNNGAIDIRKAFWAEMLEREIVANGYKVIILDPWNKATNKMGSDDETKKATDNLLAIARRQKCLFIVVHHSNKRGDEIQGSAQLTRDASTVIFISRANNAGISKALLKYVRGEQVDEQGHWVAGERPFYFEQITDLPTEEFYLRLVDGDGLEPKALPQQISNLLGGGGEWTRESIQKQLPAYNSTKVFKTLAVMTKDGKTIEMYKEPLRGKGKGAGSRRNLYRLCRS